MENAPSIILFWCFVTAVFILMVVSMVVAVILVKNGSEQCSQVKQFLVKICLSVSIACSVPIMLVVGYVLYIYFA